MGGAQVAAMGAWGAAGVPGAGRSRVTADHGLDDAHPAAGRGPLPRLLGTRPGPWRAPSPGRPRRAGAGGISMRVNDELVLEAGTGR